MVFGNAVKPRQAKLHFFARVVRRQTFLLAQARINCKNVNNFASFSVVCKIKRATAHCTYKTNLTVFPQLTVLNGKMHQTAFRCLLFSLPKSLCQRQALALPNCAKVACWFCFAQIATCKCKKMKKCPRKAYFLQNWVLTNCIFGFII